MGQSLPNGVWVPGAAEPIDWHVTPSIVGAAARYAQAGRVDGLDSPVLYRAASAAEADAVKQSNPRQGSQIYRTDTRWIEQLAPTGWTMIHTFSGVSFAPPWDYTQHGIGFGSGTVQEWRYWVHGDDVTIEGSMRWADAAPTHRTSSFPCRIAVPSHLPIRYVETNLGILGPAHCSISGTQRMGHVAGVYGSVQDGQDASGFIAAAIVFLVQGDTLAGMSAGSPAAWSINSSLAVRFTYQK